MYTGIQGQSEIKTENIELPYRASATRINDLIHTKLKVRFDYSKSYLYGQEWVTLHPHAYSTDSLQLDAKGMNINKVMLLYQHDKEVPLHYTYDSSVLNIQLNRSYDPTEEYCIYIDYVSKPNELRVKGSAAINDAKGLYFINPTGEDKDKPTQIWTQGETESNSAWFPTIDKPNQKTTEEIFMTVPDKYVTLSNGLLIKQTTNKDGTRTDYWKMDLPHAPYLFFMGVGDYSIIKDHYKDKEVSYYVEKEYAPVARKIFGNTPEMIAFYSKLTGIDYPWPKYAQITGRDYVSGAMENTTATLHTDALQQDARELVDGNAFEDYVAHELFHQWFGDLVTLKSWSNLTVNESFANFSETLWFEHKYGKDAGDHVNYKDMQGYLSNPENFSKNLVRFYYNDKEDMFDAVSYNKGGRILNMLRNYLGDSVFFKSLHYYLTAHQFKTAEAHDLRLAFEAVSGQEMNWYFNQWYFSHGHPELTITFHYDDVLQTESVIVNQTQKEQLFKIPVAIDIYAGTTKHRYKVWLEHPTDTFSFTTSIKPELVNFDGDKILLCTKNENKTLDEYIYQYHHAGLYLDRREAIDAALAKQADPRAQALLKIALQDPFHELRIYTLEKLNLSLKSLKTIVEPVILELAEHDLKPMVRGKALQLLGKYKKETYKDLLIRSLNDSSYTVSGYALEALSMIDTAKALTEAYRLSKTVAKNVLYASIAQILSRYGDESSFDFIAANFIKMPLTEKKFSSLQSFALLLGKINDPIKFKKGIDIIIKFRNEIPQEIKSQTDAYINDSLLRELAENKKAKGYTELSNYIDSKIRK